MLLEKIHHELKEALKAGDSLRVSTLRFLLSAIHNREIELRTGGKGLSDEEVLGVISRQVKQHRESMVSFTKAGRLELTAKEEAELAILQTYLPAPLGEGEIREMVKKAVGDSASKDPGSLMKLLMPLLKGKADGGLVRRIVEEELGK